jgi:hypothetical protein
MEAGQRAVERSASLEAVGHFKKGLATVLKKPPSTKRDSLELDLQLALVDSLTTTSGWGSDVVAAVSARARELCDQLDEPEKILGVLYAEFVNQMVVGEYRLGKEIAGEVLELGEKYNDVFAMMRGHLDQGWGQIGLGEFSGNIESHFTYALKHYDPVAHHVHRVSYPLDQCVEALGQQTFYLWFRGFADQSIASSQEAISIARQLDHDGTLSWALNFAGAHPASLRKDSLMAERLGKEVVTLFDENRASRVEAAWGQVYSGWGVGKHGELDEGISTLSTGLDYLSNLQMYRTTHLAFLADLCLDNGDVTAAVAALEAANARIALVSEKLWEPEILRLKSEVLLRTDPNHRQDVEACLLEAIEIARCQESKSLELRCRVALAKFLMRQDKRKKAHDLVASIYDWFTEGFDTPDLKEAKALLDQLS